ncbi:MAG: LytR C-terminal domain-containing protein [Acidobacteriota bacterium]|nr:LytR C-terminal domain-containing protein [Acidobacteriota bacterium]
MAAVEHRIDPFPWRTATLVTATIALAELVGLIAVGTFVLAHPFGRHGKPAGAAAATVAKAPAVSRSPVVHRTVVPVPAKDRFGPIPSHALRARSDVRVLVLNGNGVQGAAHAEAVRLQGLGYAIGGAANAPSHHYAQSMVMFVPGYAKEARRLARDAGIRIVAPVDGLTQSALSGSRLVVLLGS